MRTAIISALGFAFLGACLAAPRVLGRRPEAIGTAAKLFLALWLAAAVVNGWRGTRAGYTWAQEAPISLLVFALPGALAAYAWWKYG